jgi:hypothetical protein
MPELELGGRLASVGCVNCGERIFRGFRRRRAGEAERNAHKQAGRPANVISGKITF